MLKRRVPRMVAIGFLLAVATSGLSACRTAPNVAAYVGDEQVTVSELDAAVQERLADPDIAAFAKGQEDVYTRTVLTRLVDQAVYAAAAEKYDVEVSDSEVQALISEALADVDADEQFAQAAAQGFSREDIVESVRQRQIAVAIAEAEGQADALSESALRAAYEQAQQTATSVRLGYIGVPDQATADAVLAQLTAAPASYPTVAAQYPGQTTLAEVQEISPDQIPGPLAQQAVAATPGTGFTVPVPELSVVVVGFVAPPLTFEEARPQLEQQAEQEVGRAGADLVDDVRSDLGVRINPRYDQPTDSGVVDILGDDDQAAPAE